MPTIQIVNIKHIDFKEKIYIQCASPTALILTSHYININFLVQNNLYTIFLYFFIQFLKFDSF